jgi:hypothetical protein
MDIGFPPKHEGKRRFNLNPTELIRAAEDALDELDWKHYRSGRFCIIANIAPQLFVTYGEKVTIDIESDGWVYVRSESTFPLAWIDWGRNAGNVRRFLNLLEDLIDEPKPRRRRPEENDHDE